MKQQQKKHRVVVTGMGAVTPIGNSVQEFGEALFSMKSGIGEITRFDASKLPTHIAAEVKNISSFAGLSDTQTLFRDIKITFAIKAAREAINEAFPHHSYTQNIKSVLSMGLGLELFSVTDLVQIKKKEHLSEELTNSLTFLNTPSDICAHLISKEFGMNHAPMLHVSACAAGTDAIGSGFLRVQSGEVDLCLAGGTDSMINPMGIAGFCRIGAMSLKNDTPQTASRPFDQERDGFVIGEGAGFLVLEREEFALARGAKPLAVICGYGNSLDAYNVSDPHPEGKGALNAMNKALNSAGLRASDISAISAHGTGTPKNDPAEAYAIRTLLGARYLEVPVFATKSLIGHLISAAGAVETVASILSLQRGVLHATNNLEQVAEGCALHHVRDRALSLSTKLNYILKNSFGFGGANASLIVGRYNNNGRK